MWRGWAIVCDLDRAAQPADGSPGQQSGQLQQQLQELKQQYAETTRALEQRIAALEQQIEKEKASAATSPEGTVSTAELAKEVAEKSVLAHSDEVGAKFGNNLLDSPRHLE